MLSRWRFPAIPPFSDKGFLLLLTALFLFLVFVPFLVDYPIGLIALDAMLSLIVVVATATLCHNKISLAGAVLLGVPTLAARWLNYLTYRPELYAVSLMGATAFFFYNATLVIWFVMRQRYVTAGTIYGALAGYLLLGISWGLAFVLLEVLRPASFNLPTQLQPGSANLIVDMISYSFITLTTVGYGEISPVTPGARGLSMVEAILGQFYMAVFVARLIGLRTSQSGRNG
jgi:hypothetical protein